MNKRCWVRIWRLDPNWNFIIIGGVILAAIIIDQVAHMFQAKRSIRSDVRSSKRMAETTADVGQPATSGVESDPMVASRETRHRPVMR